MSVRFPVSARQVPHDPKPSIDSPATAFLPGLRKQSGRYFRGAEVRFQHSRHVLEIGSGTGQHSVYFAPRLPQLIWQTSDLADSHAGIQAWHAAHGAPNLRAPLEFDLATDAWPATTDPSGFDAVFTSNTCHIVAWPLVQRMFELVGSHCPKAACLPSMARSTMAAISPATATAPSTPGCASVMRAAACATLKPSWPWPLSTACS
jgi:SAM-dependent methyltransferase